VVTVVAAVVLVGGCGGDAVGVGRRRSSISGVESRSGVELVNLSSSTHM